MGLWRVFHIVTSHNDRASLGLPFEANVKSDSIDQSLWQNAVKVKYSVFFVKALTLDRAIYASSGIYAKVQFVTSWYSIIQHVVGQNQACPFVKHYTK